MLEQTGNAITFLAPFVQNKLPKTGLTVTVNVRRVSTGALLVTDAAATEIGDGVYRYTLASASVTAEDIYLAAFYTTDTTVDSRISWAVWTVGTDWVQRLDAPVSDAAAAADPLLNPVPGSYAAGTAGAQLARIGSAEVGVSAPVSATGRVTIYQGKDYATADGTALTWTSASTLDLTGGTVTLDVNSVQYAGSFSGSAGAWTIRVPLTAAQTAAIAAGSYPYELVAVLAAARTPPPLATGTLRVLPNV